MDNNFINHTDPTSLIDLSQVTLEQQYAKLTPEEKDLVACKLLGMNHKPVGILTFICDDYFLGNEGITNHGNAVFDYWKEQLPKIFPSPLINKYCYISFSGCIGSGKSFASRIMGLYQLHKLDCCTNAYTSLGLAPGAKLAFGFFHANYDTAVRDFVQVYKQIMGISPYFKNMYNNPAIRFIASGPKSTGSVIGSQLIYCVLSELGFWRPVDAKAKIDEVLVRYNSRFAAVRKTFGAVICDSSAKDELNGGSQRFESSVPEKELFRIAPSHWECRPEIYRESQGKTFDFYRGDSKRMPQVIEEGEDITELDKDRIIKVPIQCKFMFINNPERSLNDLAGYPYSSKDMFFGGDISHLMNCASIKNTAPEVIEVDFFNKEDTIYSKVDNMIFKIPRGTHLFVHYDIGIKKDYTGIGLCYYTGEKISPDGLTSYPTFRFPLLLAVSRKKGQSTSLDHLYQFIKHLTKNYTITFSADTFASQGILQSCQRDGIECKTISIDRTTDAAFMFKNVINTERAELPYNLRLFRECSELRLVTEGNHIKVDHPTVSNCTDFDYKNIESEMPGTKDVFDAAAGALWSCYLKYSEYSEEGYSVGVKKQLESLTKITADPREESQKEFQGMLENIF